VAFTCGQNRDKVKAVSPRQRGKDAALNLGLLLKAEIRLCEKTAEEVSLHLGRHDQYLTRVFAGNYDLRLRHVFEILAFLGRRPERFFLRHYTFGGWPPLEGISRLDRDSREPATEDLRRHREIRHPPLAPEHSLARALKILQAKIVIARTTRREVSQALGMPQDSLTYFLNGRNELKAWHVFGVLEVLQVPPARFFFDLYSAWDGELGEGYRVSEAIDLAQQGFELAADAVRDEEEPL